jgi:phosphoribosylglycinamide formyltransferase 2
MNRDGIRDFAARELGLTTSPYVFAETRAQAMAADVGLPAVVKPVMSSSGKGQSVARTPDELGTAYDYAVANMRGDRPRVIVEQFIDFDFEITLLTVATREGVRFCAPIGHRQQDGDYRTSWQPAEIDEAVLRSAQEQAAKIVGALGGHGLFGVEFFIAGGEAIFSELSPRPHDTGMVTLVGQSLNEFELHLRAILGLPIPAIAWTPSASAVILAAGESDAYAYAGIAAAMADGASIRLFSKPSTLRNRRMGVALATGNTVAEAIARAEAAAARVSIDLPCIVMQ